MKKQLHIAFVFLVLLVTSCATDKLEVQENYNTNAESVWAYDGNNSVLKRVIQELKSGSQRESLERKLAKNQVLWENARFTFIDNKKWILVPFLSENQENVVGVLTLVKNDKGKTTADMTVRTRLMTKNNTLQFWDKGVWLGYFMALDKNILGIKNGNPGFKSIKNPKALAQRQVCDTYEVETVHYSYYYSVNSSGEISNYGEHEPYSTFEYYSVCYEVPDDPNSGDGSGGSSGSAPGGDSSETTNPEDPCQSAQTNTTISQNSNFQSAKTSIITASSDGKEHGISFGKDSNGNIIQGTMKQGGTNSVGVDTSVQGVFADLHNHPNNTPISAGDIYGLVKLNSTINTFTTKFILTDGEIYSIVINDLTAAKAFVEAYPADQLPNQNPEFPDKIFYEIDDLKPSIGYGIEDRTKAMAYVLDKYNSGITLLKQNSNGVFKPLKIEEISPNTYSLIDCN